MLDSKGPGLILTLPWIDNFVTFSLRTVIYDVRLHIFFKLSRKISFIKGSTTAYSKKRFDRNHNRCSCIL
jgi:hypothetical protein